MPEQPNIRESVVPGLHNVRLLTWDPRRFRTYFPNVSLVCPGPLLAREKRLCLWAPGGVPSGGMFRHSQRKGPHRPLFTRGRLLVGFLVVPLSACGILGLLAALPWTVAAPSSPVQDPVVAYVTDYGRHTRLALQIDEGRVLEYAFGDWRYFAVGERTLWRGTIALVLPTQATLGRRVLPLVEDGDTFAEVAGAERSILLKIEKGKADDLLRELDARYQAKLAGAIAPADSDFTFVGHDASYHMLHNSNHETAAWLRILGYEIRGAPILSNFRFQIPQPEE